MSERPEFTEEEQAVVDKACRRYAALCGEKVEYSLELLGRCYHEPSKLKVNAVEQVARDAAEWADVEKFLLKSVGEYTDDDVVTLLNALEVEAWYLIEDEHVAEFDGGWDLVVVQDAEEEFASDPRLGERIGMSLAELKPYVERLGSACRKTAACANRPYPLGIIGV